MLIREKIRVGKKYIQAILFHLGNRNLIVLKGSKGYVMCGYLNLKVAEKFKDIAIKVTGVSTIAEARKAQVSSCTSLAKKLRIYKGQPVQEVLKIIV